MPALGSSAATATELTIAAPVLKDQALISGTGSFYDRATEIGTATYTGVPAEEQWLRVNVSEGALAWDIDTKIHAGTHFNTYAIDIYTSSDPAEDGSTITPLVSVGAFSHMDETPELGNLLTPATYWVYVKYTAGGAPANETGAAQLSLHGRLHWTHGASSGSGYVSTGASTVAIFGPQPLRGRTEVAIYTLATDSLADAFDLSRNGTVLTGADGGWQPPMTAEAGEVTIPNVGLGVTWSLLTWHRFYMPAAGTITFADDEARALAANAGGVTGTIIGVFTGPPGAIYTDLTFLAGGDVNADFGHFADRATVDATVGAAGWLYIAHAYAGTYDGSGFDATGQPLQVMSWAPGSGGGGDVTATPDTVEGSTTVTLRAWTPDLVDAFTLVRATALITAARAFGIPDEVYGSTEVIIPGPDFIVGTPDTVTGSTFCAVTYTPDLSGNPPLGMALGLTGDLFVRPPDLDDEDPPAGMRRAAASISINIPTPIIVNGLPTLPAYVGALVSSATATEGASHIRAIAPAPVWDGSGYVNPPPPTTHPWAARWVVDDLPDPPAGGYYWLGDGSAHDGTAGITSAARQWSPHDSTPRAPAWRSFFPYKPSVRAVDSYLPEGGVVHHAKGVHFNSQFVEHMWADFGGPRRQPFTWVIAGLIASNPHAGYQHYLLDSGRDPDAVGFPRLSASQVYQPRTISDGLGYRNLLTYSEFGEYLCARTGSFGSHAIRAQAFTTNNPRMFYGVFDGAKSSVGHWAPGARHSASGAIDNTSAQQHRYYVIGRANGRIAQGWASHILVFEIRFWTYALSATELNDQYDQLSSTYQFDKYRRI